VKRREVIRQAKLLVPYKGPNNVLEFGPEYRNEVRPGTSEEDKDAIIAEAVRQAERVYEFLGYEVP